MSKPRILLVDDEEAFVEALTRRLKKRGLTVNNAFSGKQALEVIGETGPAKLDVVVLDVKMPGMDGRETLAAIKAKHPLLEVVMLTGHGTIESAIESMKAGAADYLLKPADIDVLLEKVNKACGL
ncbi:MAG: response regulator, partial [Deltaproteobacteria bacterium]|nr:response regulator [Deltaproteobacteria bacterium]